MIVIRYATANDIPALKALWKQAFDDEMEFISLFFEKRVCSTLKNAILLEEDGHLISMLYALPCMLKQGTTGRLFRAVNLVGVATEQSYQGKGYMRHLLEGAFDLLAEKGVEAVVLKPSNPVFYEKFGFHICNTLYQTFLPSSHFVKPNVPQEKVGEFLQQTEAGFSTNQYQILRSVEDWEFCLEDGAMVSLWENGYAICEPVENGYVAYEMLPPEHGVPCGCTMYKKIGQSTELPEDIGCENLIFEWY